MGGVGVSLLPQIPPCGPTIFSSESPGLLKPRALPLRHWELVEALGWQWLSFISSAEASGSEWAGRRGLCARPQAKYPGSPKGLWSQWGAHQTWRPQ